MSLKVLFHRTSPIVRTLEVGGVALSTLYFKRAWETYGFDLNTGLFCFLVVSYLFIRACDLIPWYPKRTRREGQPERVGIQVHFQKALVPTSYILFLTSLLALWRVPVVSTTVLVLADLMMLVIAPVNGIQIYFHLRDKDPLPINYFSLNEYKDAVSEVTSEPCKQRASCC